MRTMDSYPDRQLFSTLGFSWDRRLIPESLATHSVERVCFRVHKMLAEFVWDASVLEGNPFTFPEVLTLLDGVTVGGHRLKDQEQVLNLVIGLRTLIRLVKTRAFVLARPHFTQLQALVARNDALDRGMFRGEGIETHHTPFVALGAHRRHDPPPTEAGAPTLYRLFRDGLDALHTHVANPFERGLAFFLFGALHQFFFDGNKRTSRLMMNGTLMSAGFDAISIPAAQATTFNEKMVRFYLGKDATEMMDFLISCHPDGSAAPVTVPT